jgi:hypothetical protein
LWCGVGQVVEPFLTLCDKENALSCVPHYSIQSRKTFRADVLKLKGCLATLRGKLSVASYIAKRDCKHEENQRLRKAHAHQLANKYHHGGFARPRGKGASGHLNRLGRTDPDSHNRACLPGSAVKSKWSSEGSSDRDGARPFKA